jgi:cytochrome c556
MAKRMGVIAALFAAAGMFGAEAQVQSGKTRPARTLYLMKGIVKPSFAGLDGAWKTGGPANDEAWDQAAIQAASLSEMSYALMDDGRCPDKVWADACRKMQEAAAAMIQATEKKDASAGKTAFGSLKESCGMCHKEHKKKKQ